MEQRRKITLMFKSLYGKDLEKELKSETSASFKELLVSLLYGKVAYDAKLVRASMKGAGTDELALLEMLCTRTNKEIEDIKQYFKLEYRRDLERDVTSETSGHFKRLLVSMCQAMRDESTTVDDAKAKA